MSTTTTIRTAAPTTTRRSFFHRVPVSVVTAGALVAGGFATEGYSWVARAVGVDFVFGTNGSEQGEVPAFGFVGAVVMFGAVAILFAPAVARWAKSPRRTWNRTAWALAAASLLPVAPVAEGAVSTEVGLGVAHLVAAAVVIPIVAARLATANPRRA
jgi:hypothetical protein